MRDEEAEKTVHDAAIALREMSEAGAYGIIAFGITYTVLRWGFSIEPDKTVEPAILNAGIAYYTHAATGRVLRAIHVLVKPVIVKAIPPVLRKEES